MNIDIKTFLRNYGIILLVFVLIFGSAIYLSIASSSSYKKGLKKSIITVLDENEPGKYSVGDYIPLNSSITTNALCYNCKNNETEEEVKVVIVKISSFYGPLSAVYICDSKNNVEFIGISSLHGRVGEQFKMNSSDKRIEYWKNKIPYFFN